MCAALSAAAAQGPEAAKAAAKAKLDAEFKAAREAADKKLADAQQLSLAASMPAAAAAASAENGAGVPGSPGATPQTPGGSLISEAAAAIKFDEYVDEGDEKNEAREKSLEAQVNALRASCGLPLLLCCCCLESAFLTRFLACVAPSCSAARPVARKAHAPAASSEEGWFARSSSGSHAHACCWSLRAQKNFMNKKKRQDAQEKRMALESFELKARYA